MKKIIVGVVLLGILGAGAYYWKSSGTTEEEDTGIELGKIEQGPIKQTVSCTGKVVSNLDVDIKCKASGTVIKLPFDISDVVHKGDLLVELDQIDMERVYKQSEVSLDASKARLATAKENLLVAQRTLKTDRERAKASLASAEAASMDARAKADRLKKLFEKKLASQEECDTADTAAVLAQSNLSGAKVKMEELNTQKQALEVSRQSVKLAETQVRSDEIALQVASDRLHDCIVKAPMDGVVTDRTVQTGMIIASGVSNVGGGTTILTLSDLSRIFVLASVDESDIGKVAVGQPAVITVDAYPSIRFAGKVVRIASKGLNTQNVVTFEVKIEVLGAVKPHIMGDDSETPGESATKAPASQAKKKHRVKIADLFAAENLIPEKKSLLKPEMTANIDMTTAERDNALLIPVEAVSRQAGLMYANVPGPDDMIDRKPIEVGITDGLYYELLAGLNDGDTIVIFRGEGDSRWSNGRRSGGARRTMRMIRMGSRRGH